MPSHAQLDGYTNDFFTAGCHLHRGNDGDLPGRSSNAVLSYSATYLRSDQFHKPLGQIQHILPAYNHTSVILRQNNETGVNQWLNIANDAFDTSLLRVLIIL